MSAVRGCPCRPPSVRSSAGKHDNGLTWDVLQRYVFDEYEFYDGKWWFNGECGHLYSTLPDDGSILTAHGNHWMKGVSSYPLAIVSHSASLAVNVHQNPSVD